MQQQKSRIPPGPSARFDPAQDLLSWLQRNHERYGDIYRASIHGSSVYVISSADYAERVLLGNWENYLRRGQAVRRIALALGSGIIASNGALWVRQRRMIQPAFNRNVIAGLTGGMIDANRPLREKWQQAAQAGEPVNVTRDVSTMVLKTTLLSIFGADYATVAPRFAIVAAESRDLEFAKTCSVLGALVMELVRQRRRDRRAESDLLGLLMQSRDREHHAPMPDAQLAREILTLVVAGHETTASVLNWIWYLLALHPEVDARLAGELADARSGEEPAFGDLAKLSYARQVIDEALRLYPPLWLMTRQCVADDYLGPYLVPAGTEIYISPYLLQRHPRYWEAPDEFNPERFAPAGDDAPLRLSMCPFGAGPRNCIGEFMARVEIQVHLMMIAPRLKLRYDGAVPAGIVADVNLLAAHDFMMTPQFRPARRA